MKRVFFFFMSCILLTQMVFARQWTDSNGKLVVEARFVELKDDVVIVEDAEGAERRISLSKLSKTDQDYVRGREKAKHFPRFHVRLVRWHKMYPGVPIVRSDVICLNDEQPPVYGGELISPAATIPCAVIDGKDVVVRPPDKKEISVRLQDVNGQRYFLLKNDGPQPKGWMGKLGKIYQLKGLDSLDWSRPLALHKDKPIAVGSSCSNNNSKKPLFVATRWTEGEATALAKDYSHAGAIAKDGTIYFSMHLYYSYRFREGQGVERLIRKRSLNTLAVSGDTVFGSWSKDLQQLPVSFEVMTRKAIVFEPPKPYTHGYFTAANEHYAVGICYHDSPRPRRRFYSACIIDRQQQSDLTQEIGIVTDLNLLIDVPGITFLTVNDIIRHHQIVGRALDTKSGTEVGYIATPIENKMASRK